MSDITNEIKKRRTFAIISHPDAGKTTLTEKFLLYGGAINQAGSVKGKATAKHAVSDWMEIEKERGISVTSSVLQFNYGDIVSISWIHRDIRTSRRTRTVPDGGRFCGNGDRCIQGCGGTDEKIVQGMCDASYPDLYLH